MLLKNIFSKLYRVRISILIFLIFIHLIQNLVGCERDIHSVKNLHFSLNAQSKIQMLNDNYKLLQEWNLDYKKNLNFQIHLDKTCSNQTYYINAS